ncbi:MAG: GTP-binding protein [Alphaproteobacteria bacterium]|nr:MAG: GTP-binding protein [Alphaproteobacteria bacterium]
MRMRSFIAASVPEAMDIVRREMGDDAVIISQGPSPNGKGVQITAASDNAPQNEPVYQNPVDVIGEALDKHSTPRKLQDKILTLVERLELDDPVMALAGAFDSLFKFNPIANNPKDKPLLLMGVPGVGKTVTVAKLASRAVMEGAKTICITTDAERAGAVEQLEAFTRILKIDLLQVKKPAEIKDALAACPTDISIFIDTAGVNVLRPEDLDNIKQIVSLSGAEPVFVYAAGGDAADAAEIGTIFKDIGAKRILITRMDMTRRYGSILAAADAGQFQFCNVSITPHIANGLSSINPLSLARIFLPI